MANGRHRQAIYRDAAEVKRLPEEVHRKLVAERRYRTKRSVKATVWVAWVELQTQLSGQLDHCKRPSIIPPFSILRLLLEFALFGRLLEAAGVGGAGCAASRLRGFG